MVLGEYGWSTVLSSQRFDESRSWSVSVGSPGAGFLASPNYLEVTNITVSLLRLDIRCLKSKQRKEIAMDPTPKLKTLGASLKVPSVQELAKEPHTTVPPRYVRPQSDRAHLSVTISVDNTTCLREVPVISMQRLLCGDNLVNSSELEKLRHSCKGWGFFQVNSDRSWSELFISREGEIGDSRFLQSANRREGQALATTRGYRRIWTSLCWVRGTEA
ncbi:hypothetical protein HYC85_025508 [Camellia sinensis]|uniref:Non-haem dioxygenase N-terminal domain-containing protein n=1 Tax=Camellia sinensis TaxID=4442 RepID=A0A7J7GB73_CAMSI|nr:hypothetical protein HYC85_025508 [Camellia sinensis]